VPIGATSARTGHGGACFKAKLSRTPGRSFAAALLAFSPACHCADVYASTGADGTTLYATQALDSSYTLIFKEPGIAADTTQRVSQKDGRVSKAIHRSAARHGVDARLVAAVAAIESGQDPSAVSNKGAIGLMQLMPGTGRTYGVIPQELRDPERNVEAGTRHLKALLAQYQGNWALALAAYNAGTHAIARYGERIPPYRETMLYVPAVLVKSLPGRP
jgi:soluble lytic murein transglycosylase-like protein